MKLNFNLKLPSFTKLLAGHSSLFFAELAWKSMVVSLAVLLITVLAFDAYIFFYRIRTASETEITTDTFRSRTFSPKFLEGINETLEKRSMRLRTAGENLPTNDPFR